MIPIFNDVEDDDDDDVDGTVSPKVSGLVIPLNAAVFLDADVVERDLLFVENASLDVARRAKIATTVEL